MVFCLPGDDGESKGAHDDPLAIEHLEERLHKEERGNDGKERKKHLDEEPDVQLSKSSPAKNGGAYFSAVCGSNLVPVSATEAHWHRVCDRLLGFFSRAHFFCFPEVCRAQSWTEKTKHPTADSVSIRFSSTNWN